jgi:uncharacterized protein
MYQALADDLNPWWRDPSARRARAYPVRRHLQPKLLRQVLNLGDRRAQVVEGPRQVGKTVMLRQLADDLLDRGWPPGNITYFDFSDERLTEKVFPRNVEAFRPLSSRPEHPQVLLLDEVTSAPDWNRWLKRAVDESERGEGAGRLRIVATDSSSTLLRKGATESGLGRWDEHVVETLNLAEVVDLASADVAVDREDPDWRQRFLADRPGLLGVYLRNGGFPRSVKDWDSPSSSETLRADVFDRGVRRDLGQLELVDERIQQFFAFLMEVSGGELNVKERAGQLGADERTVRAWLTALAGTRLLWALPRFGLQAPKRLGSQPKVYACDPGVVTAFAIGTEESTLVGRQVEAAVFRHLREAAAKKHGRVSFFRDKGGEVEADFLFEPEVGSGRVIFECTASRTVRTAKVATLKRASAATKAVRAVFLSASLEENQIPGEMWQASLQSFLLAPDRFLEVEGGRT